MNNYLSNPSWINQTRKNKFLKVINIFVTMTFLFNMTAFQGIFLTFPIQADAETVSNLDKTLFTSLDNSNELIPFNNGSLEVTKVVVGGNATADQFGFRLAGGVERYLYPNSGVSNVLFKNLIPGIYSVEEENNMPDYHQTDSTCTDVTVVDGQQASCTITNTRDTGTLIVIKQINNDDGGTVLASDWTIDVTGPQTVPSFPGTEDPGTTNSVITGDYNVTETGGPSGYTLSYSGDCDQNGDITIGYNETKTCILTNTYNPPEEPEVTLPTIEVNKSVSKGAAEVNETLTYLVEWRVTDADATNLTITDPIPLNSTFVLADNGGVYSTADNAVTWSLGTKSPGDSGIFTIAVTVNSLAEAGAMIVNTATIDCDETDPVSDDASTVITTSTAPILQITKDVSDSPVNPGDTVTYTVVITNVGSEDATNLTLTDVMPTNLTFADGGDNTKTFTLGDLAIGDSVTKTYDVVVSNNSGAGTYTNTATAEADNHSPISAEVDVDVVLPSWVR